MTNTTEQHKKAVLEALEKSLGVVTTACRVVGIGRTTFYEWMQKDPEFAKSVKDIEGVLWILQKVNYINKLEMVCLPPQCSI